MYRIFHIRTTPFCNNNRNVNNNWVQLGAGVREPLPLPSSYTEILWGEAQMIDILIYINIQLFVCPQSKPNPVWRRCRRLRGSRSHEGVEVMYRHSASSHIRLGSAHGSASL